MIENAGLECETPFTLTVCNIHQNMNMQDPWLGLSQKIWCQSSTWKTSHSFTAVNSSILQNAIWVWSSCLREPLRHSILYNYKTSTFMYKFIHVTDQILKLLTKVVTNITYLQYSQKLDKKGNKKKTVPYTF